MSVWRSLFLTLAITTALYSTAHAADLAITVDKDKKVATITSSLSTNVTLLFLVSEDDRRLPLFSKLAPGKASQAPLRFVMPEKLSHAVCEIADAPAGYEKDRDNYYHLTVDIL